MRVKKVARTVLILIGIIFLLILGSEAFLNFYINKRLNKYIEAKVNSASNGKYHLSVGRAGLSLLGRSFNAENVVLLPDTLSGKSNKLFAFTTEKFSLKGIKLFDVFFSKEVEISSLELKKTRIKVYSNSRKNKADTMQTESGLFALFKNKYRSVFISDVVINDAGVSLFTDEKETLVSDKNFIEIKKFLVNESTDKQGKLFFADDVRINMEQFSYHVSELYSISGRNLFGSYKDSVMSIDSIRLVPQFTKKNFGKISGTQSRVILNSGKLSFTGADVAAFVEQNRVRSFRAEINSLLISVFLDKNIDFVAQEKPSLQRILRDIPIDVDVDSLTVLNSNIVYEHLVPGAKTPGRLSFNAVNAHITGLDNSDTLSGTKTILRLNASCRFMNSAKLFVNYDFPMNTDKEIFACKGELAPMEMRLVNPILEPVAFMSIKSGTLDEFKFSFKANGASSDGTLNFFFHDLDIDVKNKKRSFNIGRKLMFMVAKAFVINKNNPGKNGKPGTTPIHYDRYPNKYFFYYTWKSLQSGIMEALGVESSKILYRSDAK